VPKRLQNGLLQLLGLLRLFNCLYLTPLSTRHKQFMSCIEMAHRPLYYQAQLNYLCCFIYNIHFIQQSIKLITYNTKQYNKSWSNKTVCIYDTLKQYTTLRDVRHHAVIMYIYRVPEQGLHCPPLLFYNKLISFLILCYILGDLELRC